MLNRLEKYERACLDAFDPPVQIFRPKHMRAPIILASPHSGRLYPKAFRKMSRQDLSTLRMNEDAYIDRLYGAAPDIGLPLLTARFPRCFVDVNRRESELPAGHIKDPTALSQHAQNGLGVVPTHIAQSLPIYAKLPSAGAVNLRLNRLYRPYHAALSQLLQESLNSFGRVLLLDCHSMPGFTALGQKRPDIILGNCHGRSCRPETIYQTENLFQQAGLHVERNFPYAGGYVTQHYGRPEKGVEVLQIEINRSLYLSSLNLNSPALKSARRFTALRRTINGVLAQLAAASNIKDLAAE